MKKKYWLFLDFTVTMVVVALCAILYTKMYEAGLVDLQVLITSVSTMFLLTLRASDSAGKYAKIAEREHAIREST